MNEILTCAKYILPAILLIWLARNVLRGILRWEDVKRNAWEDVAKSMHKKGKNYDLLVAAEERLKRKQNEPTALYWKAIAEKEMNFDIELRKTLMLLLKEAPDWRQDWMNQYIEYK